MSHQFDLEPEFLELYERCREYTMTSIERMYALYTATRYVVESAVPGDFVECGVWRGGSVMLIALTLLRLDSADRSLWLYDTFDGMTPPSEEDVHETSGSPASEILAQREKSADDPFWAVAPRAAVEQNLGATGYPAVRVRFVEGDVLTTVPSDAPGQIALLRLDTDWYASTRHELEHLYPRVPHGGVLIVDDYGYWRGARRATDDYLVSLPRRPLLQRIDYTGRLCVKP
jgi:O-methyltransferase